MKSMSLVNGQVVTEFTAGEDIAVVMPSPSTGADIHFKVEIALDENFTTPIEISGLDSSSSQTRWKYFDGSKWVAMPALGLPAAAIGKPVCCFIPTTLFADNVNLFARYAYYKDASWSSYLGNIAFVG